MILDYLASKTISSQDLVVVSPDVGGVARARAFAKKLSDAPLAIVDKRRHGHNVAEVVSAPVFCDIIFFSAYMCFDQILGSCQNYFKLDACEELFFSVLCLSYPKTHV